MTKTRTKKAAGKKSATLACGKTRRYRDRIAALMALSTISHQDKSHRAKSECRAYRCPSCRGWHLTSKK